MKFDIETIPHGEQRYDTCGDYWLDGDVLRLRVSQMSDPRYEWLILVHELVEYFIVKLEGIPLSSIDEFDMTFEANRPLGSLEEPGDNVTAPYFMAHQTATMVERVLAIVLGVFWKTYEKEVNSLDYGQK